METAKSVNTKPAKQFVYEVNRTIDEAEELGSGGVESGTGDQQKGKPYRLIPP